MASDALVRLKVPILSDPIVNTPHLVFGRWLPLREGDAIVVEGDDTTLKLWLDRSCWSRVTHAGGDVENHVNVLVSRIFADVTLHNLSEDLLNYIIRTASDSHPHESAHQSTYRELGKKVYEITTTNFNRLIRYARSIKGQYWLREYPMDKAEGLYAVNLAFDAQVQINTAWFRWFPDVRQLVVGREGGCQDRARFIEQGEWQEVRDFVTSGRRTTLVWELLAGAEWLAGMGHRRGALTEAITALEVAMAEFSKKPRAREAFGPVNASRMNVATLKAQIDHMGLSGSVHYLFPVLFSEDVMPTRLLQNCQQAVRERQNVVHNAQREVGEARLTEYLRSVRNVCQILEAYQDD